MTEHFKLRSKIYATVLIRWLAVSALIFCAVMASGLYVTNHVLTRIYSATATIKFHTPAPSAEAYSGWTFSSPQNRAIQVELEAVESPEILRGVISDLALDKAWGDRIYERSDPLTTDEALRYLKNNLRSKFKHDSNAVEVTALSDDPKEAADIANAVAERYRTSRDAETDRSPGSAKEYHVQITSRAVVPTEPTTPNRRFCYAVSAALAGMLGVMVASSVEIGLLISRAEKASGELLPPK